MVQPSRLSIYRTFSKQQTETLYGLSSNSLFSAPPVLAYFVSMNFPFLNSSRKWNHTIFVPFCLAYRTMFSRFFYIAAHIRTSFFYMANNILLLVYSILFIHLSVGHVGCFYLLIVVNNSTVNNII